MFGFWVLIEAALLKQSTLLRYALLVALACSETRGSVRSFSLEKKNERTKRN
jgi:hypothetical protein